jgi:hypothetical protein
MSLPLDPIMSQMNCRPHNHAILFSCLRLVVRTSLFPSGFPNKFHEFLIPTFFNMSRLPRPPSSDRHNNVCPNKYYAVFFPLLSFLVPKIKIFSSNIVFKLYFYYYHVLGLCDYYTGFGLDDWIYCTYTLN